MRNEAEGRSRCQVPQFHAEADLAGAVDVAVALVAFARVVPVVDSVAVVCLRGFRRRESWLWQKRRPPPGWKNSTHKPGDCPSTGEKCLWLGCT